MRYLLFTLCLAAYGQHTVNTSQDYKGVQDFSAVTRMMPVIKAADPATCSPGEFYFNSVSATFRYCSATNVFSELGGGTGSESTSVSNTGTGAAVLKAGSNVAARKIKAATYTTVTENTDDISIEGQKGYTLGSAPPGTCTVGDVFFETDATAGQNWWFCTATNTWTQQLNSGSSGASTPMAVQAGASIGQGTTGFIWAGYSSAESSAVATMPRAGTAANLFVHISTGQPAAHSLTCTVRKALAASAWGTAGTPDTAVQVVINASDPAGVYSDQTGSVAFAKGDKMSIGCTQQAGTLSSATIRAVSWEIQ